MKNSRVCLVVAAVCLSTGFAGCATPTTRGAVLPMEAGKYKSVVKRGDREGALSAVDHDAKLTCGTPGMIPGKVKEGRYVIVSQNITETEAKEAKSTGNAWADKAIELKFGDRGTPATIEVTTVFTCQS